MIEICRNNETILGKLSENLNINFDFHNKEAILEEPSKMVKFFI